MTREYEWDGLIGEWLCSIVESKLDPSRQYRDTAPKLKLLLPEVPACHCEFSGYLDLGRACVFCQLVDSLLSLDLVSRH